MSRCEGIEQVRREELGPGQGCSWSLPPAGKARRNRTKAEGRFPAGAEPASPKALGLRTPDAALVWSGAGAAGVSPKEKGAEGKGQSQASGRPGSPHPGQEGGVRAGRGRIGAPGRNRAYGEQSLCYLIENQINSRGGKKGKKVPLSQLWEAEMMGAGCPKRWGTQRERELQNKTKKMQQSREGRREGNRGGSEARGPWGRGPPPRLEPQEPTDAPGPWRGGETGGQAQGPRRKALCV